MNLLNRDDLKGKDVSDPVVYLEIEGDTKFEKLQSKIIFDNLNPLWNETFEIPCTNIPKNKINALKITIEDYDRWGRNDELGFLYFYLDHVFEEKNTWAISGSFEIQSDELKKKFNARSLGVIEM